MYLPYLQTFSRTILNRNKYKTIFNNSTPSKFNDAEYSTHLCNILFLSYYIIYISHTMLSHGENPPTIYLEVTNNRCPLLSWTLNHCSAISSTNSTTKLFVVLFSNILCSLSAPSHISSTIAFAPIILRISPRVLHSHFSPNKLPHQTISVDSNSGFICPGPSKLQCQASLLDVVIHNCHSLSHTCISPSWSVLECTTYVYI